MKVKHPIDAVIELQEFLESDLWYAFKKEFKNKEDMENYLQKHCAVCRQQIVEYYLHNPVKRSKK